MAGRITQKTVAFWLMYVGAILYASVMRAIWLRDEASGAMVLYGTMMGLLIGAAIGVLIERHKPSNRP